MQIGTDAVKIFAGRILQKRKGTAGRLTQHIKYSKFVLLLSICVLHKLYVCILYIIEACEMEIVVLYYKYKEVIPMYRLEKRLL